MSILILFVLCALAVIGTMELMMVLQRSMAIMRLRIRMRITGPTFFIHNIVFKDSCSLWTWVSLMETEINIQSMLSRKSEKRKRIEKYI